MLLVTGSVLEALLSESGFIEAHVTGKLKLVALSKARAGLLR